MMKGVSFLVTMAILALASSLASAYDPSPLQDFCVAINNFKSVVCIKDTLITISSSSIINQVLLNLL